MDGDAHISDDGRYRYRLDRRWHEGGQGTVAFVMLNPSTADAAKDDSTITRCIQYARGWGYESLLVLNLFAYRTTYPKELWLQEDPVGPQNEEAFRTALPGCRLVVCAWGDHGKRFNQGATALRWIRQAGHQPMALRVTQERQPAHPLYSRKELRPIPYSP